ncbi:MAG: hypothetical protein ABSB36_12185 [Candidatus Dormibacteria bacterium]|jgi:hypothetical protein
MTSNGQGPSPRPRDGEPRRRARGADARRHDAGSRWGLLAAASRRGRGTAPAASGRRERQLPWGASLAIVPPPAVGQRDDAGADFVLQAMQRAFQ